MNPVWNKEFEEFSEPLIGKYKIPGVSVGIAQNSEPVYHKGFGYRDLEQNLEITPATVFGLGSITKSFTCVAVMQLQEAGKLSVHDSITNYLPEFQLKGSHSSDEITIHHLLTNSSGLPPLSSRFYAMKRSMDADPSLVDFKGVKMDTKNEKPLDSYEELVAFISNLDFELLGPPGTHFSYSNDGFSILGLLIEKVSGKTYEDFIHQHILKPLGMVNSSFYFDDSSIQHNITTLYAAKESEGELEVYPAPLWWDSPAMLSAGFLKSSAQDMLNFTQMFCNSGSLGKTKILNAESVKEMMHPHIMCEPGKYYGYGLMIVPDYYGTTLVEHGGNLKGIAAQMCMLPDKGVSGIVLTNLAAVPATSIMFSAINSFLEYPIRDGFQKYEEYLVPKDGLEDYIGEYKSNEGMKLSVSADHNKIKFYTQESFHPILSIDKDLFIVNVRDQEAKLWFIRDENGEITGVNFHYRILLKENTLI